MGKIKRSPVWDDPRVKPPFGSVEVDWGHPLSLGLIGLWLFNESAGPIRNLARPFLPSGSLGSGDRWEPSVWGQAIDFDGTAAANTRISLGTSYNALTPSKVSVSARVVVDDAAGGHGIIEQTGVGDSVNHNWLLFTEAGNWKWRTDGSTDVTTPTATGPVIIGATADTDATTAAIYKDGVLAASGSSSAFNDLTGNLLIGSIGSNFYPWDGRISALHLWNIKQAAPAMAEVAVEPFVMLRLIIRRRYFVPTAAAAATGTARSPQFLTLGVGA